MWQSAAGQESAAHGKGWIVLEPSSRASSACSYWRNTSLRGACERFIEFFPALSSLRPGFVAGSSVRER